MKKFALIPALALFAGAASAAPVVVADYQGDYATTPKTGWSYLWNPNGVEAYTFPFGSPFPIGNPGGYASLSYNSTDGAYETSATGSLPQAAPGSYLSAGPTYVTLGQSQTQSADHFTHYAVLAYTFSAAEIAADGSNLYFHTYSFNIPNDPTLGNVDVEVFKNSTPEFFYTFPEGTSFDQNDYQADYSFGTVQAGDTLYIELGDLGNYSGQQIGVSYSLALSTVAPTPEPASLGLLALAPIAVLRRRRRA